MLTGLPLASRNSYGGPLGLMPCAQPELTAAGLSAVRLTYDSSKTDDRLAKASGSVALLGMHSSFAARAHGWRPSGALFAAYAVSSTTTVVPVPSGKARVTAPVGIAMSCASFAPSDAGSSRGGPPG